MHPHPGARSGVGSCEGKEADPRDQAMLCAVWREKSVHRRERGRLEDTLRCDWRAEVRRGIALLTKTSQLRVIFLMYSRSPCPRTFAESAMPRRILACQVGWRPRVDIHAERALAPFGVPRADGDDSRR